METLNILSLGGGVQSTVLALMACRRELEMHPDYVIFADPGNESADTYVHLNWLAEEMKNHDLDFRRVSAGNIYDDIIKAVNDDSVKVRRIGQPPFTVKYGDKKRVLEGQDEFSEGRLWRKCTAEYKIIPMEKEVRRILRLKPKQRFPKGFICNKMLGISLDEVQRMKPSRNKWEVIHWPLIDMRMTRWDCYRWLDEHGYKIPPKSACVICPFHDNNYWRDMKMWNPEEFESACVLDDNLRVGSVPGVKGDVYIHRDCVPLRDIDFSNDVDRGQGELWKSECTGYCGT